MSSVLLLPGRQGPFFAHACVIKSRYMHMEGPLSIDSREFGQHSLHLYMGADTGPRTYLLQPPTISTTYDRVIDTTLGGLMGGFGDQLI